MLTQSTQPILLDIPNSNSGIERGQLFDDGSANARCPPSDHEHTTACPEGEPARSLKDHAHLIELIEADRDVEVENVLFDHVQRTKDNYLAAFAKRAISPETGLAQLRGKLGL
eukprot:jgi/Tetstr1/451234/TSEL_038270.t1